jgi:hypothetical protein
MMVKNPCRKCRAGDLSNPSTARISSWPGFVPAIYVLIAARDVDARDKRGHDGLMLIANDHSAVSF